MSQWLHRLCMSVLSVIVPGFADCTSIHTKFRTPNQASILEQMRITVAKASKAGKPPIGRYRTDMRPAVVADGFIDPLPTEPYLGVLRFMFHLTSLYEPAGDQPEAIAKLTEGMLSGVKHQAL